MKRNLIDKIRGLQQTQSMRIRYRELAKGWSKYEKEMRTDKTSSHNGTTEKERA